jgi:hypothetical protein
LCVECGRRIYRRPQPPWRTDLKKLALAVSAAFFVGGTLSPLPAVSNTVTLQSGDSVTVTAATPAATRTPAPAGVSLAAFNGNWASAIKAARTRGDLLIVPAGTWPATRIVPYPGLTIRGAGVSRTTVYRSAAGGLTLGQGDGAFLRVDHAANVTVTDLTLRGFPVASGQGDDILIWGDDATNLRVQRVNLENAQGVGIMLESTAGTALMRNALVEDVSITNTLRRFNGAHGMAAWLYHGANHNTFRRITIDGADFAGIMIDAGTSVGTAASVDDNYFEDIVIRRAARNPKFGYGWVLTGGSRNTALRWTITDLPSHSETLTFGVDQSGIGSHDNRFISGSVERAASTELINFGGQSGNVINRGSGAGVVWKLAGNSLTNWVGTVSSRG